MQNFDLSEVSAQGADMMTKYDWTLPSESELSVSMEDRLSHQDMMEVQSMFGHLDTDNSFAAVSPTKENMVEVLQDLGVATGASSRVNAEAVSAWMDAAAVPVPVSTAMPEFAMQQALPAPIGVLDMPHPNNFHHTMVQHMSVLPFIAYCDAEVQQKWSCGDACEQTSVSNVHVLTTDANGPSATVLLYDDATIAVLFRATLPGSMADVLSDFKFIRATRLCADCRVHRGMYLQYMQVREGVLAATSKLVTTFPEARVAVMGWSLAGGLATFAALDLADEGVKVDNVITIGAPRIGNAAFASLYAQSAVARVSFRVTMHGDPVPHVAPVTLGWAHVGTEVFYNTDASAFTVCSGDEECSASFPASEQVARYFGVHPGKLDKCPAVAREVSASVSTVSLVNEAMKLF